MKSMRSDIVQSFGKVEQEIQQERAAALGRIGGTLQELIERLGRLRERHADADGVEREHIVREYADVRDRARLYRWYLEVQREAVGLRRHECLDAFYPVPPPFG